jgi:predicted  nucleic acid-binding Zn-ribbon protein
MPHPKLDTITREEFDRRLEAHNARMQQELQKKEVELLEMEQLLSQYENALDEIEARLDSQEVTPNYPATLRQRLQELALKTTQMASSL